MPEALCLLLSRRKVFICQVPVAGEAPVPCVSARFLMVQGIFFPTEVGYFTRKEIQEKWRLSCQVKVKQDMNIKVPKEIFGIKKWECEVISNDNVATFIKGICGQIT
jgi:Na+-transporting NADH:ubiquinone oxidoreductase subunit F